jgi:hypothetical protein
MDGGGGEQRLTMLRCVQYLVAADNTLTTTQCDGARAARSSPDNARVQGEAHTRHRDIRQAMRPVVAISSLDGVGGAGPASTPFT